MVLMTLWSIQSTQNNDHKQNNETKVQKGQWKIVYRYSAYQRLQQACKMLCGRNYNVYSSLLRSFTQWLNFFFALSNACSEYRFEVTPELEWLFLMLNLPITQTQHAKSANTCPHLTYLHLPLFDVRKIVWKWFMVQRRSSGSRWWDFCVIQ